MISARGLRKAFNAGTASEKVAIAGIDLDVARAEFVTVIGGNGAGKSTLLNLLGGALLPDEGRLEIDATDMTKVPQHGRARLVARVFQDPMIGTAPSLSIEENMTLALLRADGRGLRRARSAHRRDLYRESLAKLKLGLEDRLQAAAGTLSGGQRQALALAMATLRPPKLLLLDEHTAALDPRTSVLVMEATLSLVAADGLTTLMVTHNMEHALAYGSRVIMMDAGRIVADIGPGEKKGLGVADLIRRFHLNDDRMVLSRAAP
ncbi:ABC transporter ATP-binding protein [Reyranella sp.]|uniref:ABC transporter ATP-binding protein n=1 Tax=Reyranella sp. TaxID=1929291 RepID=UPI003783B3A0